MGVGAGRHRHKAAVVASGVCLCRLLASQPELGPARRAAEQPRERSGGAGGTAAHYPLKLAGAVRQEANLPLAA